MVFFLPVTQNLLTASTLPYSFAAVQTTVPDTLANILTSDMKTPLLVMLSLRWKLMTIKNDIELL